MRDLQPETPPTPGRILDAIEYCEQALACSDIVLGHGTDNSWDEAVQLVLAQTDLPAHADAEQAQLPLTNEQWTRIQHLLQRRIKTREPLPYLLGAAWFAGLRFLCDRRALVPRSPLGELVRKHYQPWYAGDGPDTVLDLCCGGGSIGIAAAVYAPQVRVMLADIDAQALSLAAENVRLHQVGERVSCVQSDLFDALADERFDLILCNPPYVDEADLAAMPAEFHFEPPRGLGAGADGLDLARRILATASRHLADDGLLLLEVGNSWVALEAAYPKVPFTWVELEDGGVGVLAITAGELRHYAASLSYNAPLIRK